MADIYFDPRTGDPISGEEYVRRYTLAAFVYVRREAQGVRATMPGLPPFGARCIGCGTAVQYAGDVCAICAQKPQFAAPVSTRQLAPQPAPAYAQTADSTKVTATDEEIPAGTIIGTSSHDGH